MSIKLTESRLRQIVKEEMSSINKRRALSESGDLSPMVKNDNEHPHSFAGVDGDDNYDALWGEKMV